jgi:pimeloyl-ACP methyl ester carboxylesterase
VGTITVSSGGPHSGVQVSLAFPQFSGSYPGGIHQFTFHFTDPLGPSDVSGGQIAFNMDTVGPDSPVCQLDWYVNGNIDITNAAYGNFGNSTPLSSMYCNVYTGDSSLTQTAQGYDVSIVITFPEPLPNPLLPGWTRGITKAGAVGAWVPVGARALSPRVTLDQVSGAPLYCGGVIELDGYLSRAANGTIAGAIGARTPNIGNAAGWENSVGYGEIYSRNDVNNALATNPAWAGPTIDGDLALLTVPAGAPYPADPCNPMCGGRFYTQGNYQFTNPNCTIILPYGAPAESNGNTAFFFSFAIDFDFGGAVADPTPEIDNITPSVISVGPTQITISGSGFGTVAGNLSVCPAGTNCTSSDVAWSVSSWSPSLILATLNAPASENGNAFDIQVISNGSLPTGFQSTGSTQPRSNKATVSVQASYLVSGRITTPAGNGVAGIKVDSFTNTRTKSDGSYSLRIPAGGFWLVQPTDPAYTGSPTYWFDPQDVSGQNVSGPVTANFTANTVTYVYLLHGIFQTAANLQNFYQNLTNPLTGIDTRKYYVDPVGTDPGTGANRGFTFGCASTCNGGCYTVNGTMINFGAASLASYIAVQPPPGNIILIGYSMGGLVARDLVSNKGYGLLNGHPVTAIITLGTPNLGYPYSGIDQAKPGICSQILLDMAGSSQETSSSWYELSSPYLDNLRQQWKSTAYSGYWMAAAGEQCSNPTRNLPPGSTVGCPPSGFRSDGVVCRDSALYGVAGSFPPYLTMDQSHTLRGLTPTLSMFTQIRFSGGEAGRCFAQTAVIQHRIRNFSILLQPTLYFLKYGL